MGFKMEVYEKNGESFFWGEDTIDRLFTVLSFYYYNEEKLNQIEKIEITPLTEEE